MRNIGDMLRWIPLLVAAGVVLSRAGAHETGNNPHLQSEFDEGEGTYTYILKVPVADKKESKCQCQDEIQYLQDQLDVLELRIETVLGINGGTLKPDFTDEPSPSQRVLVNSGDNDGDVAETASINLSAPEDLKFKNGTLVEGPGSVQGPSGMDAGRVRVISPDNTMNGTGLERPSGLVRSRGDITDGVLNLLNQSGPPKAQKNKHGKEKAPGGLTANENDIKTNGRTEGSDEIVDEKDDGLTVELSPDNIRPAKTLQESVIKVDDKKRLVKVIDKQDIDDLCTEGCACFKGTPESGVYAIKKPGQIKRSTHMKVYCDMSTDNGGWTVIQRRFDGSENFFRSWSHYARGFGNKNSEFWIGNNIIHAITSSAKYELRIEFEDWEGQQGFAHYDAFHIMNEENMYRLILGKFVGGNRGDSMMYHNNTMFTTKDRDNDWFFGNCAILRKSGFWFKECNHANPNGLWIGQGDGSGRNGAIITWGSWGSYGYKYSMKSFKMMVRPADFR